MNLNSSKKTKIFGGGTLNLRTLIENYKTYNEQEAKDKEVFLEYIDTFDDVLTRKNEFAHFVSSGFVINKTHSKVLMVYHNIYDSWSWTGGHADGEEDLLSVAIREVKEETGINNVYPVYDDIFMIDTLPVLGHVKKGKYVSAHIHLSVAYLLEADENEELVIKEDENSNVRWIPINEVVSASTEAHMKSVYQKAIDKNMNYMN